MADTTYAVKVSDEVKLRLQTLVEESGLSSKEFFAEMISHFELASTKKQTPILSMDIDELMTLTTRINNIFISVGERIASFQEANRLEAAKEAKAKENLGGLLQKQIELAAQYKSYADENEILKKELAEAKSAAERAAHDMERQKEIFELDKGRALLEQREQYNRELDEVRSTYQEKISRLLNLNDKPREADASGTDAPAGGR